MEIDYENELLTPRALSDFKDLEKEVEALMSEVTGDKFYLYGRLDREHRMALQLFCLYTERFMHRYEPRAKIQALADYLGMEKLEIKHAMKAGKESFQTDCGFVSIFNTLCQSGIRMNTEGWLKNKTMKLHFINRQIENLLQRKKEILEESKKTFA